MIFMSHDSVTVDMFLVNVSRKKFDTGLVKGWRTDYWLEPQGLNLLGCLSKHPCWWGHLRNCHLCHKQKTEESGYRITAPGLRSERQEVAAASVCLIDSPFKLWSRGEESCQSC